MFCDDLTIFFGPVSIMLDGVTRTQRGMWIEYAWWRGRGGVQNHRTIPLISLVVIESRHLTARAARARWLPSRNGGALAVYRGGLATLSSAEG